MTAAPLNKLWRFWRWFLQDTRISHESGCVVSPRRQIPFAWAVTRYVRRATNVAAQTRSVIIALLWFLIKTWCCYRFFFIWSRQQRRSSNIPCSCILINTVLRFIAKTINIFDRKFKDVLPRICPLSVGHTNAWTRLLYGAADCRRLAAMCLLVHNIFCLHVAVTRDAMLQSHKFVCCAHVFHV